jgi:hypothetical protein
MATDSAQYLADKKAELAEVKAAISSALKAQEYSLDDGQGKQTVKRANLKDLRQMQRELEAEILRLENGGTKIFNARPA